MDFFLSSCFREFSGTVCMPSFVSFLKFSPCLCVDETWPQLSFGAPYWRAERLQLVSHVVNFAAAREPSFATWLLPGCCKVTGFSFEPHSLSLLWPQRRRCFWCCWWRVGLLLSADLSVYPLHHSMRGCVICFGDGPDAGFLDGEAKGLPIHPHRHALWPAVGVKIVP